MATRSSATVGRLSAGTVEEISRQPVQVHVRSSYDGISYDTADWQSFDNELRPGKLARRMSPLDARVRFVKVPVENRDVSEGVSNVKLRTTLGVE